MIGMAVGAGQALLNQGLGMINQNRQSQKNKEQAKYQQELDKETMKYSYDLTNTTAMMRQLKANNLNPTLAISGGGGAAGQTVSTGNSSANGVGMIDNKVSAGDAIQMELLNAQKENIEADTKLKEADANKKSGVDTELAKGTLGKIIAETTNENAKTGLIEIQKSLGEIDILESGMSRYDRMYKIHLETKNAVQELNRLTRENEIGDETKEDIVIKIKLQAIGARLDNELKRANINLTEAQIYSLREQIRLGWFGAGSKLKEIGQKDRELKIKEFNAKADAIYKGASTVLGRVANDIIYDVSSEVDNELK